MTSGELGARAVSLAARATALGVATSYRDWAGREVPVEADVVEAVLAQLGDGPTPRPAVPDPGSLPMPPRCWGWSVQLYALWSENSWGMGDLGDLRDLAGWSAREFGADLVLVNPLHAVAPVHPIVASPYSPTSRRYVNPLYLRITDLPEYAAAPGAVRAAVDALRLPPPDAGELIDRDTVWDAKLAALQALWPFARVLEPDGDLLTFATFCALAESHGVPWQDWPQDLRDPTGATVSTAATELSDRVAFHAWLQLLCDEQLAAAQTAATEAGMRIGIVHDLAVGVDPGGADAWALQEVLASEVTVGAPPDSLNQRGQDWALPPWRPDTLAAKDYLPFRAMVDATLTNSGGLRVDHVMGLFRLWWIPPGETPDRGTYVGYDATALLDVLVASALDRGAIVVGEDLGTVEPSMREALRDKGILGSSVLWFERAGDDPIGPPKPPAQWRDAAMASISTHDLPTAAGFLAGEQVRVRAELGQLTRPVADEQRQADDERRQLVESLVAQGFLAPGTENVEEVVLAMHRLMAATPSRIVLASPYDIVGEIRQPNLPGTTEEYPNWRIPLAISLESLRTHPRLAEHAAILRRR